MASVVPLPFINPNCISSISILLPNSVFKDPFYHFHSMFQQLNSSIRSTLHWIPSPLKSNTTLDFQSSGMQPSCTISLHKSSIHRVPISPVDCTISATSPDKPRALSFHLFQCCSNFIDPDAICWSFFNPADILYIHGYET